MTVPNDNPASAKSTPARPPMSLGRRLLLCAATAYLVGTYFIAPMVWREVEGRHPALAGLPQVTFTHSEIPGDPLNIALVGLEHTVSRAMLAAGWHPADPLTFESCLRIAGDTVLRRPYTDAPVSSLYVWGRKQDLAFEQPVGHDPRQRHHVRFWRSKELDEQGRPMWVGAATFDTKVGFSHTTGQITHHISPDVDTERDKILADLQQAAALMSVSWIDGFHQHLDGYNGGGDRYHTDGRLPIALLIDLPQVPNKWMDEGK